MIQRIKDKLLRRWIRQYIYQHQLQKIIMIIWEENAQVHYEDNVFTRHSYVKEMIDNEKEYELYEGLHG